MSRISLSAKAGRALLGHFSNLHVRDRLLDPAIEELRAALAPRRRKPAAIALRHAKPTRAERQKKKSAKRATRREHMSKVAVAVVAREGFVCACGCGRWFRGIGGAAQVDHFFGKARAESVDTCWRLRADCHQRKSESKPNRAWWLRSFIGHAEKHGYAAAAEEARAELESEALVKQAAEVTRGA